MPTRAFTPLAAGGASFNPLTSYTYRPIGVIISMTPRVTYENEIVLDLEVENSTRGDLGAGTGGRAGAVGPVGQPAGGCRVRKANSGMRTIAGRFTSEDRR